MNEGVYRVLRVLGDGRARERAELARESGEALSVLDDALRRHPSWFEERERALRASQDGFAALGRELLARAPRGLEEAPSPSALEAYRAQAVARAAPRRELDQVYATEASVFARAARLIEAGEVQRGIAFLGDDDLTSLAIHLLGVARQTTVIDVDPAVLERLAAAAEAGGWEHRGIEHDVRDPLPRKLLGRFGCVFADPPYAPEGFALFISRAIELLKPDGRVYLCFGASRRASERGLEKQRLLTEAGLLVEAVIPDFNAYVGAESIGARSDLWILRATPKSRPLVRGRVEGELYSSRSSASKEAEPQEAEPA